MKQRVAQELARRIGNGEIIGIGSGSTVELALRALAERIQKEKLSVYGVPTSRATSLLAAQCGVRVLDPVSDVSLSWCFDGADEVDPELNLIKGQGAAMLNEKIIAKRSGKVVIIVSEDKLVTSLGSKFPVPVECIPEAVGIVERELKRIGATEIVLRRSDLNRLVVTDHGNLIFDARFRKISSELDLKLKSITGVVEHGLFFDIATEVLVAKSDGIWSMTREAKGVVSAKV